MLVLKKTATYIMSDLDKIIIDEYYSVERGLKSNY